MFKRAPDVIIGELDNPYLLRWWLIPKNRFFNVYLHRFMRSDDDRALHDHPWWSLGMILSKGGKYWEHLPDMSMDYVGYWFEGDEKLTTRWEKFRTSIKVLRHRFQPVLRRADHIHRVELLKDEAGKEIPVWTLFITGPKIREWGFWCPKGFKHWQKFVETRPGGNQVGPGCDG